MKEKCQKGDLIARDSSSSIFNDLDESYPNHNDKKNKNVEIMNSIKYKKKTIQEDCESQRSQKITLKNINNNLLKGKVIL